MLAHHVKITVIACHYSKDEIFWLGYKCRKCGLRFVNIQQLQEHSFNHRIDGKSSCKTKTKGICPLCKKFGNIEKHHYSYKDFEIDPEANTEPLCNSCHGKQQKVQKEIREGIPQTYIGHILEKFC